MRLQRSGAIINISSVAARENSYPLVTYKATKAAMIAFTEQLALQNAPYGIRANCILPGLMDTPMAVDTRARASNRRASGADAPFPSLPELVRACREGDERTLRVRCAARTT